MILLRLASESSFLALVQYIPIIYNTIEGSCRYIEYAVADSRQGVVIQFRS
jgi:hypothetical protein